MLIHHIKQALDGLRALPEMAEILPGVVDALNRWRCHEAAEMTERFMHALSNLGVAQDAIERFVTGTDTEEDHCTARELEAAGIVGELSGEQFGLHEHIRALTNERDDLRRQLETEREAHASQQRLAIKLQEQLSAAQSDLDALTRWVPYSSILAGIVGMCTQRFNVGLSIYEVRHTPESLAAWKAQQEGGGDDPKV